ncbi:MAG: tetratricopeptide repeat protein, partial [Okeania sp. SIO3B3]|nr:tetratricopeptide repeat protein [Okeania sp. SIO3B3]
MDLAAIRTQITKLDCANQHGEALKAAGKAVNTAQNSHGEQDPVFAAALVLLGDVYHMMNNLDKAKDVYAWALSLNTHPNRGQVLNKLTAVYLDLGDPQQVEKHVTDAMGVSLDEAEQIWLWDNQGRFALMQGRREDAGTYLQQALTQRQQTLDAKHPDLALSLRHLAQWHQYCGTYQEAEPLYMQAFRLRISAYAKKHPLVAQSLADLGQMYHILAQYDESESLYEQARATVADGQGRDTLRYASILDSLAALYQDLSRYPEAEPLYREAMAIREVHLGNKHPDFAASLDRLAHLQHSQGDDNNAKGTQQWALDIKRQALGNKHLDVADSLDNLGRIWQGLAE